jgi:hypothetical protein
MLCFVAKALLIASENWETFLALNLFVFCLESLVLCHIYNPLLGPEWFFSFAITHIFHRPPLWYSGQNSWLQIQKSGFYSRRYQIFWEVVGLEQGPLSLVSTTEELLGRKNSGSGLENWEYGLRNPSRIFYCQKLALTSQTSDGRSVDIVRSRP